MDPLKIKKVHPSAKIPQRATRGSAGYDLCACIGAPVTILPGETVKIGTGVAIEIPGADIAGFVFARSGLATKFGLAPANCVGVIDSDYRGEIIVGVKNSSEKAYVIQPDERIAQLVLMPVFCPPVEEVQELSGTSRGTGGFGSTGKANQGETASLF